MSCVYEYSNPIYEPRIHDFGDSYHMPDVITDEETESLLYRVKKIKRKYTNWFDYTEACKLYDDYMTHLFDKYGGKDQFDLQCLLGRMNDYIPNYPELRKTRKNKYYRKNRITKDMVEFDEVEIDNSFLDPEFEEDTCSENDVKIKIKNDKIVNDIYNDLSRFGNINTDSIVHDLNLIDDWFRNKRERIERIKGNKKKKRNKLRKLNRTAMRMSLNYRSLTDRINLYDKERRDKFLGIEPKSYQVIQYKGTMCSTANLEELEVIDDLKRIGVNLNKLDLKKLKVIRLSKKAKKKKKKKNKRKEDKFIDRFTSGEFDDFEEYQEEMLKLTGSRRFD